MTAVSMTRLQTLKPPDGIQLTEMPRLESDGNPITQHPGVHHAVSCKTPGANNLESSRSASFDQQLTVPIAKKAKCCSTKTYDLNRKQQNG
ncbi:hypothetical protein DY000_02060987 [Brassica cretica]|uniref:Uncharacterized protein n=1 Tax=Brassica cretica TaxID=69181 RepID=A0ABQ7B077_BRACR|nr:hypothetical protein DY000_02060987 [Brassica cretica]